MFEVGTIKGANNRVRHNVYENGFTWYARATTLEAAERIARLLNEDGWPSDADTVIEQEEN